MIIKRIKRFFGFGNDLPKKADDFINRQGDEIVKSITVYRFPIYDVLSKFLNVISLGMFKKLQDKVGYEKLFHLGLVINGDTVIEKNEVLNLGGKYSPKKDEQTITVPVNKRITIRELIQNTQNQMKDKFTTYNAFNNNCQDFALAVLSSNGLITPEARTFIKQDVSQIVEGLPEYVKTTTNLITTLGGLLTYLRQEIGLKDGGVITDDMIGELEAELLKQHPIDSPEDKGY